MKLIKKLSLTLGFILVLFVGAVVALPIFFQDQINAIIKEEVNKRVDAKVDYDGLGVSVFTNFPHITFCLHDFTVDGIGRHEGIRLASIEEFGLSFNIISVIQNSDQLELVALDIINPNIDIRVDEKGANYDIMKDDGSETSTEEGSSMTIKLRSYTIEDAYLNYIDLTSNLNLEIENLDHQGSGNFADALFDLSTYTKISSMSLREGPVAYLSRAKVEASIDLAIDQVNNKYTFKENELAINALKLKVDGFYAAQKNYDEVDLKLEATETSFKNILSLIPAVYRTDFQDIDTKGDLVFKANAKGRIQGDNYPAFNVDMQVKDAMFKYPSLPTGVNNINFTLKASSKGGSLDNTIIEIPRAHLDIDQDPINLSMTLKNPVNNPWLDAKINGKLDLAKVPNYFPLEGVEEIRGTVDANIAFTGSQRDVDRKNYAAIKAAGDMKIKSMNLRAEDIPVPLKVTYANLAFSPQRVDLERSELLAGSSDFKINGHIDNLLSYMLSSADLQGSFNVNSKRMNMNEWMSESTNDEGEEDAYIKVPDGFDIIMNGQFAEVEYDGLDMKDVSGLFRVRDERFTFNRFKARTMGGSMIVSGYYETIADNAPNVQLEFDIRDFDIVNAFAYMTSMPKIAPVAKYLKGSFSTDIMINTDVDAEFNPILSSMMGAGEIRIPKATLLDFPVLKSASAVTKIKELKAVELADIRTKVKFENGRVYVQPFDLKLGKYNATVVGSNGFDESLDYTIAIDVPSNDLGPAKSVVDGFVAKNPIPGFNNALPSMLTMHLKVGGSATDPDVKIGKITPKGDNNLVKEALKNEVNDQIDDTKQKVDDAVQEQKDQFKEEAERRRKEAEAKRKAAEEAARKKAEEAKKEAEDAVNDKIDEKKDEVKDKIKDKLKGPW